MTPSTNGTTTTATPTAKAQVAGWVPEWVQPPPKFQPFDYQGVIQTPADGVTTDQIVLSFVVPVGFSGVIKRLSGNYTGPGFVQGSGNLIWRIIVNGVPVKNYSNILIEFGSIVTPRTTDGIIISSGQVVQYVVNRPTTVVASPGTFVICTAAGYYWPQGVAQSKFASGTGGGSTTS